MNKIKPYIFWVLLGIGLFTIIFALTPSGLGLDEEVKSTPKYSKIEQKVYILDDDKKSTLELRWILENEEALKDGTLTLADCPYTGEKTIYKLKTSMDSISSFVYGSQTEIEKQKCIEYNKFVGMRNEYNSLNKPLNCK